MKKSPCRAAGLCAALLLSACAGRPDHFYTISTLPEGERGAMVSPVVHTVLTVSVPTVVDRAEMIVNTSDIDILVLDHERWAVPLSDQVSQTLARDIERRRADVLVGDQGFDQATSPPIRVKVDLVRMTARRGSRVVIEAHWRIVDERAQLDVIGGDVFEATLGDSDYRSVAAAYSLALSDLADRLSAAIPR